MHLQVVSSIKLIIRIILMSLLFCVCVCELCVKAASKLRRKKETQRCCCCYY